MPRAVRPGTAAWRYYGDFRTGPLALHVLLMQVAHPVVAAGVLEHSTYQQDPWGRLWRTMLSLSTYIYGGQQAAEAEARRLWELHRAIKGVDAEGHRYHALNPDAYAWVHATLVRAAVDAQVFFGRGMSKAEVAEYYAQMCDVGRILGVLDKHMPADWAEFVRYYDEKVQGFGPNQATAELLVSVQHVRKPSRVIPDAVWAPINRGLASLQLFFTAATLPPEFRDRLGLTWTPEQQRKFDRFARVFRVFAGFVPPRMRNTTMRLIGRWNARRDS